MESVNVLFWGNSVDNSLFVDVLRQRELYKNTVYSVVAVKYVYKVEELLLCGVLVESVLE